MSEEVEKIKEKIMDYMKRESCSDGSCLFDDLERGVPEIKDDDSKEGLSFLHFTEPYQNTMIWALNPIGAKAINELLLEKKLQLNPCSSPQFGMLGYLAGTKYYNEAQKLLLVKKAYPYKKPHWCPCSIKIKKA